jgi:flagellar hook-associated protein 2
MSIQPLVFTGVSSLSNDLQTVLNRAVSIASIPLQQAQTADSDVIQKKALLTGLDNAATALGNAVASLGAIAANRALSASSSNTAKVTVQNTGASAASTYTISDVTSIASAASETSVSGYADANATPVSSTGSMQLTFGSQTYDISLSDNTLIELRDKINNLGAGVTATILTTGSSVYLSLAADRAGATTLKLIDDPGDPLAGHANTNILTSNNQGSNLSFKLNGIEIDRSSNTVNDVIPGVAFDVLATTDPGETVTLTLATDRSRLSKAISTFVDAYNSLATAVGAQVGQSAGLLSGSFVVRALQDNMRALASYSTSGEIQSLWEMGLEFDNTGKLSFDANRFSQLSDSQINGAISFFGSPTTGFGALADKFDSLTDPISGAIRIEQDGFDQTDKNLQAQIAILEDRISAMQQSMSARLQLADSLLAQLESQQKVLAASVQSINLITFGKKDN